MIQATPAYLAANERLNKVPVFLIAIEGYGRAFSDKDLGGTYRLASIPPNDTSVVVPGTSGPWDVNLATPLNASYDYDSHDWTAPIVYPRTFTPGDSITLALTANTVTVADFAHPVTGSVYPGSHCSPPTNSQGAIAAWCDGSGVVIQPVFLGAVLNIPVILTCPAGASTLQLGFNDKQYNDNGGSYTVAVQSVLPDPVDAEIVPWLVSQGDLTTTVNELDGSADDGGYSFNVQDRSALITADFPDFVFEGKRIVLLQGFLGLQLSDFLTLFTGKIDSVSSDNSNLEYKFVCVDALQNELARSIFEVADDGYETSSDHVRTLNGHPLDILLLILQNELGLPAARIDLAKIQNFRDTVLAGAWFYFEVKSPPGARDFITGELMRPLGGYLRTNNLGQVTVNFMYPLSLEPVMTLDSDTLTEVPLEEQADFVNQVQFRFDYDADDKPLADSTTIEGTSLGRYGPSPLHTIEARGMRSGFQGFYWGSVVSRLIFHRFAMKNAKFEDSASLINIWSPAVLAEPGDLVALTCPYCPDRAAGRMGIFGMLFEVADRTLHLQPLTVGMTLLRVNFDAFEPYLIAPTGHADFMPSSAEDRAKYMFQCDDNDQYSDGSPANTLT